MRTNESPEGTSASENTIAESITQFRRDHQTILHECKLLSTMARKTTDSSAGEDGGVQEAVACIRRLSSLLNDHQAREERVMIPIVERRFDSEVSETMRKEHLHIMELLGILEETITAPIVWLNKSLGSPTLERVTEFDSFLRAHFAREENVLFWFASLPIQKLGAPAHEQVAKPLVRRTAKTIYQEQN